MRVLLLCVVVAAGCVESNSIQCADGRICPAARACDEIHHTCVVPDQLVSCAGLSEGDACSIDDVPGGVCRDTVCVRPGCGNGIVEGAEDCDSVVPAGQKLCTDNGFHDDGNVGCNNDCTFNFSDCSEFCGDGIISGNEACDVGDQSTTTDDLLNGNTCMNVGFYRNKPGGGLKCSAACTLETSGCEGTCGDKVRDDGFEDCDTNDLGVTTNCNQVGFYQAGALSCDSACQYVTTSCVGRCGDGIKNGNEVCDPGTTGTAALDGKTCLAFGYYGTDTLRCSAACTFDTGQCTAGRCGDSTRNAGEQCEHQGDGNANNDDFGGFTCESLGFYDPNGLSCNAACGFDTSGCSGFCGDRTADPEESCEGEPALLVMDPLTYDSCLNYGFESGNLDCNTLCTPQLRGCHRPTWSTELLAGTARYADAWGSHADNVFVIGNGEILHWNGLTWTTTTLTPTLQLEGIHGSSATNVFAVGAQGRIMRNTGSGWVTQDSLTNADLASVWTSGPTDAFAVGKGGIVRHWNGSQWNTVTSNTTLDLTAVWGVGPNDVFILGTNGAGSSATPDLRRCSSTGCSLPGTLTPNLGAVDKLWGSSAKDLYAVGQSGTMLHHDGNSWSKIPVTGSFYDIWGSSPTDVYVADGIRILHYNGTGWTSALISLFTIAEGIFGISTGDIITVGNNGGISRYDAARWQSHNTATSGQQIMTTLRSIAGAGGVLWTGGTDLWRAEGASGWTQMTPAFGDPNGSFSSLWSPTPTSVIGVGSTQPPNGPTAGAIKRFDYDLNLNPPLDTGSWTPMAVPPNLPPLTDVWGSSPTDLFAVGGNGTILHYNGNVNGTWTAMQSNVTTNFQAVWGFASNDVYAAGLGTIVHWNGTTWSPALSLGDGPNGIEDIWGSGPNDIYAVGYDGKVRHYDGVTWSLIPGFARTVTFYSVLGTGPSDVYIAGTLGSIYHYDGKRWSQMASPTTNALYQLGTIGTDIFAVGDSGTVLRRGRRCNSIERSCGDGVDDDCDGRYDCSDTDCSGNPACNNGGLCPGPLPTPQTPLTIACGGSAVGNTASSTYRNIDRYACAPLLQAGPEITYQFTTTTERDVTATLSNMSADLDVTVMSTAAGGGCEPRSHGCLASGNTAATFRAKVGQTYYIVVDGYNAAAGEYTLTVTCP